MSSLTPAAAIEARLKANWSTSPVFLPNEINKPLRDNGGEPLTFVVLEFPGGTAEQETIGSPGNNVFREHGGFLIHIQVPMGSGASLARQYAETIAAIFRGQTFDGVRCWAPNPPQEDTASDGAWFGVSFFTPFQWDRFA